MHEAFDRLDVDHTGVITKENLRVVMGTDYDPAEVDAMIAEGDIVDQDGEITYDEFAKLMRGDLKQKKDGEQVSGMLSPRSS